MRTKKDDLIYDVGMNDGADTAYYLHLGYKVVSIDADPAMIEMGRRRFAREIADQRLTLLNMGVASERGSATFWICDDKPEWNSFDRELASRGGRPHHSIEVPTLPFGEVLEQYGVPHFLKIDIEGHDHHCLTALAGETLPAYISTEAQPTPCDSLSLLEQAGYQRFKLVRQNDWSAGRRRGPDFAQRLVTSAAYGRLRPLRMGWMTRRFTDRYMVESLGYGFEVGSSGPWGEDAPGRWMSASQGRATMEAEQERVRRLGIEPVRMWWDWHAKV